MEQTIIEYAPIIVVLVAVFIQWRLFVTPVELEKKHRAILKEVEERFVSWVAFKSLQDTVNKMDGTIIKIYDFLIHNHKED